MNKSVNLEECDKISFVLKDAIWTKTIIETGQRSFQCKVDVQRVDTCCYLVKISFPDKNQHKFQERRESCM